MMCELSPDTALHSSPKMQQKLQQLPLLVHQWAPQVQMYSCYSCMFPGMDCSGERGIQINTWHRPQQVISRHHITKKVIA